MNIQSATLDLPLTYTLTTNLVPGDSVRIQDPVQSKFFLGASNGTWMTRDALDLSVKVSGCKLQHKLVN